MRIFVLIAVLALAGCDAPASTTAPREAASCGQDGRTAVLLIDGQSNAANYGLGLYASQGNVVNFDQHSGRCYKAVDPLLGADGPNAAFATRLGDILIDSGRYDKVVLVTVANQGRVIAALSPPERINGIIETVKRADLRPTHILFQQGESDAGSTTTAEQYASHVRSMASLYRSAGISAPFYLARASRCALIKPTNRESVRSGQLAAVNETLDIRRGPDMDDIGPDGRNLQDGCHLNIVGVTAAAALWAAFIH